jgi:hypothetical protein
MRIIGKSLEQTGYRVTNVPGQGPREEFTYVGKSDSIDVIAQQYVDSGAETRNERAGPAGELVASRPIKTLADIQLTLEMRMQVNRVQKDLLEPDPVSGIALSDADIRAIREGLRNPQAGSSPAITDPTAIQIYLLMMQGVKYRIVYQPVMQYVRSAPSSFVWPPSHYQNVSAIHSDAQMINDQGVKNLLNFSLASEAYSDSPPSGFVYGWLKHCPWYETAVGNRTTENVEFEFGLWPTVLYGTV